MAGPRSATWPFQATAEDLIAWSSTQSTATVVGALIVVLTFAALGARPVYSAIGPWVLVAILVVVLAFTKIAIPEAASLSVLTALHIVKSCVAGVVVGAAAYATRHSRAGWIALATGMFGGVLLVATQGTVRSGAFAPSFPYSSSVFGEPAWWLVGASFVLAIAAAVTGRGARSEDVPARSDLARLVGYAAVIAVVGRIGLEVAADATLWVRVPALVVIVLVVDRIGARWEAADARVVVVATAVLAAAVSMWNVRAFVRVDATDLLLVGVAGLVVGVAIGAALRRWPVIAVGLGLLVLAGVPVAASIVDVDVVSVVALGVVASAVALTVGAVVGRDGPDATVRPLALALPGMLLLFAAVAPVPAADGAAVASFLSGDLATALDNGDVGALSAIADRVEPGFGAPADPTSAYLMLGVVVFCALRVAMLSRRHRA